MIFLTVLFKTSWTQWPWPKHTQCPLLVYSYVLAIVHCQTFAFTSGGSKTVRLIPVKHRPGCWRHDSMSFVSTCSESNLKTLANTSPTITVSLPSRSCCWDDCWASWCCLACWQKAIKEGGRLSFLKHTSRNGSSLSLLVCSGYLDVAASQDCKSR